MRNEMAAIPECTCRAVMRIFAFRLNEWHERDGLHLDGIILKTNFL